MTNTYSDIDPFDTLLTLEDSLYTNAHSQGVLDGAKAGRIEGRLFGLEKGFEKFAELGELHGRSAVWAGRLPQLSSTEVNDDTSKEQSKDASRDVGSLESLPALSSNPRLQNNIILLSSLTDPETFSTDNTEEAVADFEDRFKRAGAKAKVIERIIGEKIGGGAVSPRSSTPGKGEGKKGADSNMEDFAGGRLLI